MLKKGDSKMVNKETKTLSDVMKGLNKKTPPDEKRYRIGRVLNDESGNASVLTYIDARYVMDTLDEICGADKWSNEFIEIKGNLFCKITIKIGGESVSKMDVGVPSNFDSEKGEASDSFKRCAVHFGIGRDLYNAETIYAECVRTKSGQWVLPKGFSEDVKFAPTIDEIEKVKAMLDAPCFDDEKRDAFNSYLLGDKVNAVSWKRSVNNVTKVYKNFITQV